MFRWVFADRKLFSEYVNEAKHMQKILEPHSRKFLMSQAISLSSAFETLLYIHTLIFLEECMRTNLVSTVPTYNSCMRLGGETQVVVKTWNACTQSAGLGSVQTALQPHMFYNNGTLMFGFISTR